MWIVDRKEGKYAVLEREDGSFVQVELCRLPAEAEEGDCLAEDADGELMVDAAETEKRKKELFELQNRLFGE